MMLSHILFMLPACLNNETKHFWYVWLLPCSSLTNQIFHPEQFIKPVSLYAFLPSFDHSLSQLQAVGPSTCESHQQCHQRPKSLLVTTLHSFLHQVSGLRSLLQKLGKLCHFLFKWPSSLSRDNLPVAVLNKKRTAMICILMVQLGSLGQCLLSVPGATTPPSFIMPLNFSDAIMWS